MGHHQGVHEDVDLDARLGVGEDLPLDPPLPQATRRRVGKVALRLEERIDPLVITVATPEVDVVERTSPELTHHAVVLGAVQMHGHRPGDPQQQRLLRGGPDKAGGLAGYPLGPQKGRGVSPVHYSTGISLNWPLMSAPCRAR